MKKFFTFFVVFTMLCAVGCQEQGDDNVDPSGNQQHIAFLNNSNTTPTMVAGGGTVNITFKTDYSWQITKDVDWLSTSLTDGEAGTYNFFISASANDQKEQRNGVVIITLSNGHSCDIVVTQEPSQSIQHLVCQNNEILYTTKYNYILERDFSAVSDFGETPSTICMEHNYNTGTYGQILFNNDVTKIPDNAFAGCASLETIYLPDGVKSVGKNAFSGCAALHSIISVNSIDNYQALIIDDCLCAVAPAKLEEYVVPYGVVKIGAGAFSGCATLKKVIIPEGVREIAEGAFEDCENLEYIKIPKSLTIFEGSIITGKCNDMVTFDIPQDHPNLITYTSINSKPIDLYSYENVIFDDYDETLGGCVLFVNEEDSCVIPNNMFRNCATLANVNIPNSITSIGDNAFYGCSSLASIDIPEGVTSIGDYAFYGCSGLAGISIPFDITSIGNYVFYGCSGLASIDIPDSVSSIGEYAFYGCSGLVSVDIPESVMSIGDYAFRNCSKLATVYCEPTTPPSGGTEMFHNNASGRIIYVHVGYENTYATTAKWSTYSSSIEAIPYTPKECISLSITADDVRWNETSTTIYFTAETKGSTYFASEYYVTIEGTAQSSSFAQNTSTSAKQRTISFTYLGCTAKTTITQQGKRGSYSVDLYNQWRLSSTFTNPNSSIYEGVYESYSNYNKHNSSAWMFIDIEGYDTFTIYVASDSESGYDYVKVYELDSTSTIKAKYSGTNDSLYAVTFTNIGGGSHTIAICYSKDSISHYGTDRGYLLIPKNQ